MGNNQHMQLYINALNTRIGDMNNREDLHTTPIPSINSTLNFDQIEQQPFTYEQRQLKQSLLTEASPAQGTRLSEGAERVFAVR